MKKVDVAWSPGADLIYIATYKSQKTEEINIFVTADIGVLHFKCFKIDLPFPRKRYVLAESH